MAKGGGAIAGAFIASIILSVAIAGGVGYLLIPKFISPACEYEEFDSTAQLLDSDLTWSQVPDTELNITIKKNSRISATFSSSYSIGVSSSLGISGVKYEIALCVENVGNSTVYVKYLDMAGVSSAREICSSFSMHYITGSLSKGTYRVYVAWRSIQDPSGTNYFLFTTPLMDYNRSLTAIEIYS
ncbi:MAG: hypothetical protein JW776_13030 [Candidatus Lokiarchaeota archaeon]|nr:hypothetical protein [Candidatus Lokiarchaeota archaeon]